MNTAAENQDVSYARVNELVLNMLKAPSAGWYALFVFDLLVLAVGAYCWGYQIMWGTVSYTHLTLPTMIGV